MHVFVFSLIVCLASILAGRLRVPGLATPVMLGVLVGLRVGSRMLMNAQIKVCG
jgi:NhaP-type Na+/H+ or K+/H+ antiporter